jgi:hypothetical protein
MQNTLNTAEGLGVRLSSAAFSSAPNIQSGTKRQ